MDTIQLTLILRKDKFTRGEFQGVYPSDKLPTRVSTYPALYIANVDKSGEPGSHWVAFYFTRDREGEFFDSYGQPPSTYSRPFASFLKNNSSSWTFNSVTLQSVNSKVCGHYCVYFALFRCRRVSMNTIVHRFSTNRHRNDLLVKRVIEKRFPLSPIKKRYYVNNQGTQARVKNH